MLRRSLSRLHGSRLRSTAASRARPTLAARQSLRRSVAATHYPLLSNALNAPLLAKRYAIIVKTSETPNPDCLRFYSMDISFLKPDYSIDIPSSSHAYKSPLAALLFGIEGVSAIFIADEYITVRKSPHFEWTALIPLIQETVIEFSNSKESVLSDAGEEELVGYNNDTEPEEDDDEVVLAVKELLATRIRPMLRADGGNVRYIDMSDGTVYLLLEGACKACPSSHITLKSGIERMLMHWIPEVIEALEVSDEVAADILSEKKLRKKMLASGEVIKAL